MTPGSPDLYRQSRLITRQRTCPLEPKDLAAHLAAVYNLASDRELPKAHSRTIVPLWATRLHLFDHAKYL